MNLLRHPNVRVTCQFIRGTFSFLPPDHWSNTHRAVTSKWQVLVIEIANDAGKERYHTGSDQDLEDAERSFGAKPVSIVRPTSEGASEGVFSAPDALFCKANKGPCPQLKVCPHTHSSPRYDRDACIFSPQIPEGREGVYGRVPQ